MVRPFPHDLVCSCGEFIFTPSFESSRAFVSRHFARGHIAQARVGKRIDKPRFSIKRHPIEQHASYPWSIADRNRPHWLGHAVTHEEALAKVEKVLADERRARGDYIPTRREIREAMMSSFDEYGVEIKGYDR